MSEAVHWAKSALSASRFCRVWPIYGGISFMSVARYSAEKFAGLYTGCGSYPAAAVMMPQIPRIAAAKECFVMFFLYAGWGQ